METARLRNERMLATLTALSPARIGFPARVPAIKTSLWSVHGHIGNEKKRKLRRVNIQHMVSKNVGGRDRLVRALLAVVLTLVTVRSLRSGKRKSGLLAVVGALGLGFNATTCFCGLNKTLGVDTTDE